MAARVKDRLWEVRDMVTVLEAWGASNMSPYPLGWPLLELLREGHPLPLVVRIEIIAAVQLVSEATDNRGVPKPPDDLPMLQRERHAIRADLQDSLTALCLSVRPPETRVKETSVVNPELPRPCILGHHFCGRSGRHAYVFPRG